MFKKINSITEIPRNYSRNTKMLKSKKLEKYTILIIKVGKYNLIQTFDKIEHLFTIRTQ